MHEWLTQLSATAPLMPYLVVIGIFFLTGFGLPFPEDIPIIAAGYVCAVGYADPWLMFPVVFGSILGSDAIVFFLGRKYGHHVPRLPLLRRYLSEKRLGRTEAMLHAHGGKFMFAARFLPGLRTPAIFTAGSFKVPYWRFLLYDGAAAAVSVPTIFFLAFIFSEHLDRVRHWIENGQVTAIVVIVALVAGVVAIKLFMRRRAARIIAAARAQRRASRKPGGSVKSQATLEAEETA
jgi:membrane protein DedA with SNARE-associated domain